MGASPGVRRTDGIAMMYHKTASLIISQNAAARECGSAYYAAPPVKMLGCWTADSPDGCGKITVDKMAIISYTACELRLSPWGIMAWGATPGSSRFPPGEMSR